MSPFKGLFQKLKIPPRHAYFYSKSWEFPALNFVFQKWNLLKLAKNWEVPFFVSKRVKFENSDILYQKQLNYFGIARPLIPLQAKK